MWLCDQRSVTPAFLTLIFEGFNQKAFLKSGIGSSSISQNLFQVQPLQQCDKRVKTNSQKVETGNFNVWRKCMRKTGKTYKSEKVKSI